MTLKGNGLNTIIIIIKSKIFIKDRTKLLPKRNPQEIQIYSKNMANVLPYRSNHEKLN